MNSVKKGKNPTQGHRKVVLPEDRPGVQDKDANKQIKKEASKINKKSSEKKNTKKSGLFSFGGSSKSRNSKKVGGPRRGPSSRAGKPKVVMEDDFSNTTMIDTSAVSKALDNSSLEVPTDSVVKDSSAVVETNVQDNTEYSSPIKREVIGLEEQPNTPSSSLVISTIRDSVMDKDISSDRFLNMMLRSAKSISIIPLCDNIEVEPDYLESIFSIEDTKAYLIEEVLENSSELEDNEDSYIEPAVVETRKSSSEDLESIRNRASNFQKDSEIESSRRPSRDSVNTRTRSRQRKRSLGDLLV